MSGDRQPRPGDRVRVQARATEGLLESFDEETGSGLVIEDDGTHRSFRAPFCSVEVLEPADDPSKDPIGTVRQEDHEDGRSVWQCVVVPTNHKWRRWECVWSTAPGNIGSYLAHETVAASGFRIVGCVPGTPAAEQPSVGGSLQLGQVIGGEKPEPPLSAEQHEALLKALDRKPRVFTSDGPEPPEDVKVVVAVARGDYPHPYFVRFGPGWSCSPTPVAGGSRLNPVPWRNTQYYGLGSSFREVIS